MEENEEVRTVEERLVALEAELRELRAVVAALQQAHDAVLEERLSRIRKDVRRNLPVRLIDRL